MKPYRSYPTPVGLAVALAVVLAAFAICSYFGFWS